MERGLDNWLFGVEQINEDPEILRTNALLSKTLRKPPGCASKPLNMLNTIKSNLHEGHIL
jgi:hypothetical protein